MNSSSTNLIIHSYTPADEAALFDICLRTADAGEDASELYGDPRLPGYIWAAAYGALEPDFAFLLADGERRLGYVLAAPDTAGFFRRLDSEWWPRVRRAMAGFRPTLPLDENAIERITTPEGYDAGLLADYPAHLHINVLPEAQSGGWGRRLVEVELAALQAAGVRGVYLGVAPSNERAIGFYRHLGFEDLSRDGNVTFGMKLR